MCLCSLMQLTDKWSLGCCICFQFSMIVTVILNYLKFFCDLQYAELAVLLYLNIYLDHFCPEGRNCPFICGQLNSSKLDWKIGSFYQNLNLSVLYYDQKKQREMSFLHEIGHTARDALVFLVVVSIFCC